MADIRILVSSAGRRCELIQCLREDSRALGLSPVIIATDSDPEWSSACLQADKRFRVPRASDPAFYEALQAIVTDERIDIAIPTIDPELHFFARLKEQWTKTALSVVSHSLEFVELCRNKTRTMQFLNNIGVATPRSFIRTDLARNDLPWPLIVKPIDGSASAGIRVYSQGSAELSTVDFDKNILQECLSGPEYTINAYISQAGQVQAAVAHRRHSIRAGEVEKAEVVNLSGAHDVAAKIAGAGVKLWGPLCFQAKVDSHGNLVVFEINARFGGGFPLARHAGANFTKWLLQEHLHCGITRSEVAIGCKMVRYDQSIFIDP